MATSSRSNGHGKGEVHSCQDLIGRRSHLDITFEIENREAAIDVENRTVEMSILSDQPIRQWWFGRVILDHKRTSVRMDRMKAGAPLLLNHNINQQIGVLENVRIENGKTRATARFSKSALAEEIFQDVRDGIRRNTSGGFIVHEIKLEKRKDGEEDTYRALDWEPFEGSVASIPADITVGSDGRRALRTARSDDDDDDENEDGERDEESEEEDDERSEEYEEDEDKNENKERARRPKTLTTRSKSMAKAKEDTPNTEKTPTAAELLQLRITEFTDTAAMFGDTDVQKSAFRTLAHTLALDDAKTLDDLKRSILEQLKTTQTDLQTEDPQRQASRQAGVSNIEPAFVSVPKNFRGASTEEKARKAFRFAQWGIATLTFGNSRSLSPLQARAQRYCADNGILIEQTQTQTRGQLGKINEAGGYVVPHEFGNDLIALFEDFGVFRRNAKIVPMASDSRSDPRRDGGMEAFWEDEAEQLEESEKKWGLVGLKAKKLTALGRFSAEVNEDSMVNFGDDLAGEIAYAFTFKEDRAGFLGGATKTDGGITGVCPKLKSLKLANGSSATIAQTAGLTVATGTGSYDGILLKDFSRTKAKLPAYALARGPKWYMHQSFFSEIVESLILASGGITADMIAAGVPLRVVGYPVEVTQVMPFNWETNQIVALFGVLMMAARLGDRRSPTIALSEHVRFMTEEIVIRGTERLDINVHDVGNAAASAADRVPGPIVGLITASS